MGRRKLPVISCVYKITNKINNKIYIGSTSNYHRRYLYHTKYANNKCSRLVKAFNKYGIENFRWEILEYLDIKNKTVLESQSILKNSEQKYLDKLLFAQEYIKKENKLFLELGYNLQPVAYSSAGRKELDSSHKETKVVVYNMNDGSLFGIFESYQKASIKTGDSTGNIGRCCRDLGGICKRSRKYIYRYFSEDYEQTIELKNKYKQQIL